MTNSYLPGDGPYEESSYYSKKERTLESALFYAFERLSRKDINLESEAGRRMLAKEASKLIMDNKKKTPWWWQRFYTF
tara:strand:- start:118 stop:351 length:234 start_codon:yes stop_codon:yes gene_type:complete